MPPFTRQYYCPFIQFFSKNRKRERKKEHKYCITKVEAFGYILFKVEVLLYLGISKY